MQQFLNRLRALAPTHTPKGWLFVGYDQLSVAHGPLSRRPDGQLGIVLCETTWRPKQRPYHQQKLALVLANQRHFALEQAERGIPVRYLTGSEDYASMLSPTAEVIGPIDVMEPAEREMRVNLEPLVASKAIRPISNPLWLSTRADFVESQGDKWRWRMDRFYKHMRRKMGLMLTNTGAPLGGKWSHDAANRKPWKGEPAAPSRPHFESDEIDREVYELVRTRFGHHPGQLTPDALPTTKADATALWRFALGHCLTNFGAYEDAMNTEETYLFHTNISQLLNLGRLSAAQVITDVMDLDIPLNSKEGFIRQIIGWREFVRHVHRETDGFRQIPQSARRNHQPPSDPPDDTPSFLGADRPLPATFWQANSGLNCLDHVVTEVWQHGYTHHINRLMVLANWATLLDVSPRALSDWFWVAFVDAYDWVVEPNVIGMGTFAVGELMTTKPYISGASYINKMSNYCQLCQFSPGKTCPMTPMYWAFLERHRETLTGNVRLALPLASAAKRSPERRADDLRIAHKTMSLLAEGKTITPAQFEQRSQHA